MDYKYIEQLLERYWECETSVEEEAILRAFFSQTDLPAGLSRYRHLFEYEQTQGQTRLSAAFDERMLSLVEGADKAAAEPVRTVKARHVTWTMRLRPLFRGAAAVAIVTLLGTAAQHSFNRTDAASDGWDYNSEGYTDSYQDPQQAYEASMKALRMFKTGAQTAANDTAKVAADAPRSQQNVKE